MQEEVVHAHHILRREVEVGSSALRYRRGLQLMLEELARAERGGLGAVSEKPESFLAQYEASDVDFKDVLAALEIRNELMVHELSCGLAHKALTATPLVH